MTNTAAGAGPASTSCFVTGSTRKLSPSSVREPSNVRSPGSPKTTSSPVRFPDTAYYLTPRGIGIQWQVPDTFFFSFPQDPLSNAPLTWAVRHSPTTYGASGLAFCPLVSVGTYWTADSILLTSH